MNIRPVHWALLLVLVALWGSSYLMVEIALTVWRPEQITGLRILAAAVVLIIVMLFRGLKFPLGWRPWGNFLVIAVIGNCLPFFLISWGQQEVETGLAGILAATTPLVVLVLAHFVLADERLSPRHVLAFLFGFAGIIVLMGPDSLAALGGATTRWWSQLAILGGAVCYAIATVMVRRMPAMSPIVTSAGVMIVASCLMSPFSIDGARHFGTISLLPAIAMGLLGILGTGLASILYFRLVAETSARFTSLLNYLVPFWAAGLGALVLQEELPLSSWLALALISCGLILTSGPSNNLTRLLDSWAGSIENFRNR
jgi:drug/metabolite transporter (DMT)-like permease